MEFNQIGEIKMLNIKRTIFMVLLLFISVSLFSESLVPVVTADLNSSSYMVGKTVEVEIKIMDNPGIHGLSFDLAYDPEILDFVEITDGSVLRRIFQASELLYSVSKDPEAHSGLPGAHVIVGYSLKKQDGVTKSSGSIVKLKFRIKQNGYHGTKYRFGFNNAKLYNIDGEPIEEASWLDSEEFSIVNYTMNAYISIDSPYENGIFYSPEALLNLTSTKGDYSLSLSCNNENGTLVDSKEGIDISSGFLLDEPIILDHGTNKITAELYDDDNNLTALDVVHVYRSDKDKYIKIINPSDHQYLNTDLADVEVEVSQALLDCGAELEINGSVNNIKPSEKPGLLIGRVWLKDGFNTINARLKVSDKLAYEDKVTVFYQKDSSVFTIVDPYSDRIFKPSPENKLVIRGEIDSEYKRTDKSQGGLSYEKNSVTLRVTHTPFNPQYPPTVLVDDRLVSIRNSDIETGIYRSQFMFINDFDIPLEGLSGGEIEIIAYKNKRGNSWDKVIHRIAYIDDNKLWIDLKRPNVFTSDLLDTEQKIKDFYDANPFSGDGNIKLSHKGAFELANNATTVKVEKDSNNNDLSDIKTISEALNGDLYALQDNGDEGMRIYKKTTDNSSWQLVLNRGDMNGYTIYCSQKGLLVGVSHRYSSTDSGVYILSEDGGFDNIEFPDELIKHVQFITGIDRNRIYLYGSNYANLYSFSLFDMEPSEDKYRVSALEKCSFENSFNDIQQFELTNNGKTAVLRTENDEIKYYKRVNNNFAPNNDFNNVPLTGKRIVYGEYDHGEYNVYVIIKDSNLDVVMENRRSGKCSVTSMNITKSDELENGLLEMDESLIAIAFQDNNFNVVYQDSSGIHSRKGRIFFDKFFPSNGGIVDYSFEGASSNLTSDIYSLIINRNGSLYHATDKKVYSFVNLYRDSGTASFDYMNPDIEGLTGISFEIDPVWIGESETSYIEFEFQVKKNDNPENTNFGFYIGEQNKVDLSSLLDSESDEYKVDNYYDRSINREIVFISFNELQKDSFIHFGLKLNVAGDLSPALENLKIHKKVKPKLSKGDEGTLILPLHGYIYDRTVNECYINNSIAFVERDGSFSYQLPVNTDNDTQHVELRCMNSAREEAKIDFTIDLIDSVVDLGDVKFKATGTSDWDDFAGTIETQNDSLEIKGNFWGLTGVIAGYRLVISEYENGREEEKTVRKGIFNTIPDFQETFFTIGDKKYQETSGYLGGEFNGAVELLPGPQKIILYTENPDGLIKELPVIEVNYVILAGNEGIEFLNLSKLDDPVTEIDGVEIINKVVLNAFEEKSESGEYRFVRTYQISGIVNVSNYVSNLKVKSMTEGLSILNEEGAVGTAIVKVGSGNRFFFDCKVEMEESIYEKDFYLSVIPVNPSLNRLKRGMMLEVSKSFKETEFFPDFSLIHPSIWSEEEKRTLKIPVRVGFNRNDVPLDKRAEMYLTTNYEYSIKGYLDNKDANNQLEDHYYLRNLENDDIIYLTAEHIKKGINRFQWKIEYNNVEVINSSYHPGMGDYIFDYEEEVAQREPTVITFPVENIYYKEESLPSLAITKDPSTLLKVELNNHVIWEDMENLGTLPEDFSLIANAHQEYLLQGNNSLEIIYSEAGDGGSREASKSFDFLYDSVSPEVDIASYTYNDDYLTLQDISVNVVEGNFKEAYLHYNDKVVTHEYELVVSNNDNCQVSWKNLTSHDIYPCSTSINTNSVKIEVVDHAGNTFFTDSLDGYDLRERPDDEELATTYAPIDLQPLYDGSVEVANETDFDKRPFPGHVKFAPGRFLDRVDITNALSSDGSYLITNNDDNYAFMESADTFYFVNQYGQRINVTASESGKSHFINSTDFIIENEISDDGIGGYLRKSRNNWSRTRVASDTDFERDIQWYIDNRPTTFSGGSYIPLSDISERVDNKYISTEWTSVSRTLADFENEYRGDLGKWLINNLYENVITDSSYNDDEITVYFDTHWQLPKALRVSEGNYETVHSDSAFHRYIYEYKQPGMIAEYYGLYDVAHELSSVTPLRTRIEDTGQLWHSWSGEPDPFVPADFTASWKGYYVPQNPGDCNLTIVKDDDLYFTLQRDNGRKFNWTNGHDFILNYGHKNWNEMGPHFNADEKYFMYMRLSDSGGSTASIGMKLGDDIVNKESFYIGFVRLNKFLKKEDNAAYYYQILRTHTNGSPGYNPSNSFGEKYYVPYNITPPKPNLVTTQGPNAQFVLSDEDSLDAIAGNADSFDFNNNHRFVVFKVKKTDNLITVGDLEGKITFDFVTRYADANEHNTVEKVTEMDVDGEGSAVVTDEEHLYYIVDTHKLKEEYNTVYEQTGTMSLNIEGKKIIDRGALRVNYTDITPVQVYMTGKKKTDNTFPVINDVLIYDFKYERNNNNPRLLHNEFKILTNHFDKFKDSSKMSVSFWLRIEDTDNLNELYSNKYKRLLTLGRDKKYQLGYQGNKLDFKEAVNDTHISMLNSPEGSMEIGKEDWNLITLLIDSDKDSNNIELYLGDTFLTFLTIPQLELIKLLKGGEKYYFGAENPNDYNTGFYSIAQPVTIDRLLTEAEIERIRGLTDQSNFIGLSYVFNDDTDFGTGDSKLSKITYTNPDYINHEENVNYHQDADSGSLNATSRHRNYLEKNSSGQMVFEGALEPVVFDMEYTTGDSIMEFEPQNGETGKYYFGYETSNYNLGNNPYYSLSGTVLNEVPETAEAYFVFRINDKMERYKLKEGPFHFVFENKSNNIPHEVKLYLETDEPITISTDICLNEGNYKLPGATTWNKSATMGLYPFDLAETIDFWYKPLNSNKDGLVNYEAVLFDSEYIKIGTELNSDNVAVYYFEINKEDGVEAKVLSDYPVDYHWQHIQLSYNHGYKLAYLYINGKTAGIFESSSEMSTFGSLVGDIPSEDNIFIGCDKDKLKFAEGYIDEFSMVHQYKTALFSRKHYADNSLPFIIGKNSGTDNKWLDFADPNGSGSALFTRLKEKFIDNESIDVQNIHYVVESMDNPDLRFYNDIPAFIPNGDNLHSLNIQNLPTGRYRITVNMLINSHKFTTVKHFDINNVPIFKIKEQTPVIFEKADTDILLKYWYDKSRVFNIKDRFAVLKATIRYTDEENESRTKTRYITQDFINNNPQGWMIGDQDGWADIEEDKGLLTLDFKGIKTINNVEIDTECFYFRIEDKEGVFTGDVSKSVNPLRIPLAKLSYECTASNEKEYKLHVSIGESGSHHIFSQMSVEYLVENNSVEIGSGSKNLDDTGKADFFYDDILPSYGEFSCDLSLYFNGIKYYEVKNIDLNWMEPDKVEKEVKAARFLEIDNFSLLHIDKNKEEAVLLLEYDNSDFIKNIDEREFTKITAEIEIYINGKTDSALYPPRIAVLNVVENQMIFEDISIPNGTFTIRARVTADPESDQSITRIGELKLNNSPEAPEIVLTNSVDSFIQYNDVYFSWKGFINGDFNKNIEYTYNFDNKGWSTPQADTRDIRLYNLDEIRHSFQVKAIYNGIESSTRSVSFCVDINKPEFDSTKITVEEIRDPQGILYEVDIVADEYAIKDSSLREIYVNNERVVLGENGSFIKRGCPITVDGTNKFIISAYDKVGNFADHTITVENNLTEILFPTTRNVKYSPVTVVGKINENITSGMEIYVFDPFCEVGEPGDYSGWKKARINGDRTFFIENIFINPGTPYREIGTALKMVCVLDSGRIFENGIEIKANEIMMPIEMKLSTHAAEGENSDTYVKIDCKANVENISSWSVDYDGDGVYDSIDIVDNPHSEVSREHSWEHKYASLGLVEPRVRVITTDGNFFSVYDRLIIHEKIKEASNKMVIDPISMTSVRLPDNSYSVYVLKGNTTGHEAIVYSIGRNDTYISNKEYNINLTALGIENPVVLRAYADEHLIVGSRIGDGSKVYELKANNFGNYTIRNTVILDYWINDITLDEKHLYISMADNAVFYRIAFKEGLLDTNSMDEFRVEKEDILSVGSGAGIAKDEMGLLVSDFSNQRILRISNSLNVVEQFGTIGTGEKEFVKPSLVKSYNNRIFVYDQGRKDIQVFDQNYQPVCTLEYNGAPGYHNYLEADFFNNISDMDIVTRREGNLLYYYALLLSKETGRMALLRLPQWQELRARVRNNKIVFIQDGEVFTAKPDGSDLAKIVSSDSIPRVKGTIDFPALSPDGRTLVFTSKARLYNGEYTPEDNSNPFAYDNIYLVNIESKEITKIELGTIEGHEIERPVFNSNGDKVIFSAKETDSNWQIYIYDFSHKSISQLFSSEENARFPYYSPDDRFVVFTTDYDGDEDIVVMDTLNTTIRVEVTSNEARDSLPVWNGLYPFEIEDEAYKIESKMAFVSERNGLKGLYYVYLSRKSDSDIRIVTKNGEDIGDGPDRAAIRITRELEEGDYPGFTGDGRAVVFEYFDGEKELLKKYDFSKDADDDSSFEIMELPGNARRPAGMKNSVTNFTAENVGGNNIELNWNRYTDSDIFYRVQFRVNQDGSDIIEKLVSSQTGTVLRGLQMGTEYLVRVYIKENDEEVATSQWKEVKIPEVAAIPLYEIDLDNPYTVTLNGWTPTEETRWIMSWIINNVEYNAGYSPEYSYEFGSSGTKTIVLKTSNTMGTEVVFSEPFLVDIKTDIEPVIHYSVADDSCSIELDATGSPGSNIDWASTLWRVSGSGRDPVEVQGCETTVTLDGFKHKINVELILRRKLINNEVDVLRKSVNVDLSLKEVKPVITYEVDDANPRLARISGAHSLGNIDWSRVGWVVYADTHMLYETVGVSTFAYQFPERSADTTYSVALTVPRRNDSKTETGTCIIAIEHAPVEPVIDYEILTLTDGDNVIGAKVLLDCSQSRGSGLDFSQAKWSVPIAASYSDQPTQYGPTAIFNLTGIESKSVIEVALTLSRQNGLDPKTVTRLIKIQTGKVAPAKLVVNIDKKKINGKYIVYFDALKSTGANIEWDKTLWNLGETMTVFMGPAAQLEVPLTSTERSIPYTCTLYRSGIPEVVQGKIDIDTSTIRPLITSDKLGDRYFSLSVLDSKGYNIDWERTMWYIYDGNENVQQYQGAQVAHTFAVKEEAMGYPVMAVMYFKDDSKPFYGYTSIDVQGDEFIPMIQYSLANEDDPNTITFDATGSKGSNIQWNEVKWTFGDSSEQDFGAVATHRFPLESNTMAYTVTLTLGRRSGNGTTEVKTVTKEVTIGQDDLTPVIKVLKKDGDYLVLSAEDSLGRGVQLDRSTWLFEGEGDNSSYSTSLQDGQIINTSLGWNAGFGFQGGTSGGVSGVTSIVSVDMGLNGNISTTSYNDYINTSSSFSTDNSHVGAVCRRYLRDKDNKKVSNIIVTLFVYRISGVTGEIKGESITVKINTNSVKEGDVYGK